MWVRIGCIYIRMVLAEDFSALVTMHGSMSPFVRQLNQHAMLTR